MDGSLQALERQFDAKCDISNNRGGLQLGQEYAKHCLSTQYDFHRSINLNPL
jgi:hypothetical protein